MEQDDLRCLANLRDSLRLRESLEIHESVDLGNIANVVEQHDFGCLVKLPDLADPAKGAKLHCRHELAKIEKLGCLAKMGERERTGKLGCRGKVGDRVDLGRLGEQGRMVKQGDVDEGVRTMDLVMWSEVGGRGKRVKWLERVNHSDFGTKRGRRAFLETPMVPRVTAGLTRPLLETKDTWTHALPTWSSSPGTSRAAYFQR